jgi:hypothetical protein
MKVEFEKAIEVQKHWYLAGLYRYGQCLCALCQGLLIDLILLKNFK